ncbi:hypothetical protein [Legionella oakridgensis]|uniref:hypothetical protein n=1 Tax=Legionella oakridgensis TaxID=29423 RepID=UPI0003DE4482|nr:hypothetical protein [Legionella oakridgensis]ETO93401.1 hypothetical protein LOR_60c14220 [Legionella oakridgensis RV-2-2007]
MDVKQQYVLIVKPKSPIKEWLKKVFILKNELPGKIEHIDFSLFERDSTVYLLPSSVNSMNECTLFIQKEAIAILEFELEQFIQDKSLWPQERSFTLLTEWFDFEVYPQILTF